MATIFSNEAGQVVKTSDAKGTYYYLADSMGTPTMGGWVNGDSAVAVLEGDGPAPEFEIDEEGNRIGGEDDAAVAYYVETYAADGSTVDAEVAEHDDLAGALADVAGRLGRHIDPAGDWIQTADTRPDEIPANARPVASWHESDEDGCGGVGLWVAR